jgi:hypothetical protein
MARRAAARRAGSSRNDRASLRHTDEMWSEELQVSDDVSPAGWIAPRLAGGGFGAVTRTVPSGYSAYARICHPAVDRGGRLVAWSEVARATGRQTHPVMQWHALVGSADYLNMQGSLWPGSDPERGNLVPEVLGPLCDLLADHTATPEQCFFCLWEGWGWIEGSHAVVTFRAAAGAASGTEEPIAPAFSVEELSRPRVHLPGRDYLFLAGSLAAALQIGCWLSADWFDPQSPNLFWPADRAWCVATEIDFDSTLLGGTTELIEAVLEAPTLDSWSVRPDDSLAFDADQINPVP